MIEYFLQVEHEIQRGCLRQVQDGVAVKDFVIESNMIEANDQIRTHQLINQLVNPVFSIDLVCLSGRAVGDPNTHFHIPNVIPSTHLSG